MNKIIFSVLVSIVSLMATAQESATMTTSTSTTITKNNKINASASQSTVKGDATSTTNLTKNSNIITTIECNIDSPCYIVQDTSDKVLNAVNKGVSQHQIMSLIKTVVTPQFDFTLMTRYALGNNWKLATPNQQELLVENFKQLLIYTYSSALSKFKGAKIIINNESITGKTAAVITQVTVPNSQSNTQPIKVEYDLAKTNEAQTWKAYDIKIENASLVTTYRNQFNEIIQNSNIDGLIKQLKTKVATLQKSKM